MGMRKPVQKPMLGNVAKPKPNQPAITEPAPVPVYTGKIDKMTGNMKEEALRRLQGGKNPPNATEPQEHSMLQQQSGSRLSNNSGMGDIASGRKNPPKMYTTATEPVQNSQPALPPSGFGKYGKNQLPPKPNPIEDAIKAQLGDRYADYQKARENSLLNGRMQTMDHRQDPITGQWTSSTDIGNREQLFKQFGIDTNALPKPAITPVKTISPLEQFKQTQQKMYQTQPASQQMQAPEAEPMQPASQQMQSAQQAPAQDNSAIDAQIAQLQQQIAQLQAQKK